MTESPEHQFLSHMFLSVLDSFSKSRLYSYRESERKKFDFSCFVTESWDYALDGQTLWGHSEGVDKDMRTLLVSSNARLSVYIARDTMRHRAKFFEAARDYRSSGYNTALKRLKVFWIPSDFDADSDRAREFVGRQLQTEIVEDLLFNVVFGRLSGSSVRATLLKEGMFGLVLAILHLIAANGFVFFQDLEKKFEISGATLRDRMLRLQMSGFLLQPRDGSHTYHVGSAGRSLLRICSEVRKLVNHEAWLGDEMVEILRLLEIEPDRDFVRKPSYSDDWLGGKTPEAMFGILLSTVVAAESRWGVDWTNTNFVADDNEHDQSYWLRL
jgi:hypothetical protein